MTNQIIDEGFDAVFRESPANLLFALQKDETAIGEEIEQIPFAYVRVASESTLVFFKAPVECKGAFANLFLEMLLTLLGCFPVVVENAGGLLIRCCAGEEELLHKFICV